MFRDFNCHLVAGSDGHHTRIMAQHLKGLFNWEMESLPADSWQKREFSSDTGTEGPPGQHQHGAGEKKAQLEGYLKRKISSLRSEEVSNQKCTLCAVCYESQNPICVLDCLQRAREEECGSWQIPFEAITDGSSSERG